MEQSGQEFDDMHDRRVQESHVTAERRQDEDMSAVSFVGLPRSLHPSTSHRKFQL